MEPTFEPPKFDSRPQNLMKTHPFFSSNFSTFFGSNFKPNFTPKTPPKTPPFFDQILALFWGDPNTPETGSGDPKTLIPTPPSPRGAPKPSPRIPGDRKRPEFLEGFLEDFTPFSRKPLSPCGFGPLFRVLGPPGPHFDGKSCRIWGPGTPGTPQNGVQGARDPPKTGSRGPRIPGMGGQREGESRKMLFFD